MSYLKPKKNMTKLEVFKLQVIFKFKGSVENVPILFLQ